MNPEDRKVREKRGDGYGMRVSTSPAEKPSSMLAALLMLDEDSAQYPGWPFLFLHLKTMGASQWVFAGSSRRQHVVELTNEDTGE